MQVLVVSILFLALVIAIFALQNPAPDTIRFLFWRFGVPRVLIILGSAFAGGLAVLLAGLFRRRRRQEKMAKESAVKPEPQVETPVEVENSASVAQ